MKALCESTGIALLFSDLGTRRGWWVSVMAQPLATPGKDPVPSVQETGWAPGPVWTGAENLTPTRIRSLDRPVRSQSLYRMSYPAMWKLPSSKTNVIIHPQENVMLQKYFILSFYSLQCCIKLPTWVPTTDAIIINYTECKLIIRNYK
jgi:hypothetical protein